MSLLAKNSGSVHPTLLLIAEDNPDDRMILEQAFHSTGMAIEYRFVANGQELMAYLNEHIEDHPVIKDANQTCRSSLLILLDLDMPVMDGRKTLQQVKSSARFSHIPVVILTTSCAQPDIQESYKLGANAFITKPHSMSQLKQTFQSLCEFWFDTVTLPIKNPLDLQHQTQQSIVCPPFESVFEPPRGQP